MAAARRSQIVLFILAGLSLATGPAMAQATRPGEPAAVVTISPAKPVSVIVVNFADLAAQEALNPPGTRAARPAAIHAPRLPAWESPGVYDETLVEPDEPGDEPASLAPSPPPFANFDAQTDPGTSIPPDTMGAVGPSHVVSHFNTGYRVQSRTGVLIAHVTMGTFWSGTSCATGPFDPRVVYDPYQARWIVAAVKGAFATTSAICVGVSATSDPTGSWTLTSWDADGDNNEWADFPMLGFNKNWIAVGLNMFTTVSPGTFTESRMLILDYPAYRGGTFTASYVTGITGRFCLNPAETLSATESTLYVVEHVGSASGTYRLHTITGTPAAPALGFGALMSHPLGPWTFQSGNVAPQSGGALGADVGDPFIRNNAVFRDGKIWYTQAIGLPAGGAFSRTAVQWTVLGTTGAALDAGRIDDPTGATWRTYPSVSVNAAGDALIGFTQASTTTFYSAAYAFRPAGAAAGTTDDPRVYQVGHGSYVKTFGSGRNRWGDYSHVVVDPANDTDFWTVQEYATAPVGVGDGSGRFATRWAKVVPPAVAGPPDLRISSLLLPKYISSLGGVASVTDTTRNDGVGASAVSSTRVYYSVNSKLDGTDTLMPGTHAVPALGPAASNTATFGVTAPAGGVGKRFFIAHADQPGAIVESLETNNTLGKPTYAGPDLSVSKVTAPASAARGSAIALGDTTKNPSVQAVGIGTVTQYFLSLDNKLDGGDTSLGARAVGVLAAGASNTGSIGWVVPVGLAPGGYFIIARADATTVVAEAKETNNNKPKAITIF